MKGWLDLTGAATYTSLSVRTLRRYLSDPVHPLPAYPVGGKWVMHAADIDTWIQGFKQAGAEVEQAVEEILRDLHVGERPRWNRKGPRSGGS